AKIASENRAPASRPCLTIFPSLVTPHQVRCRQGLGYGPWELSADRANAVRQVLESEGIPSGNTFMVAGKADTDRRLFPDDPYMSPNRRVTVTLMREKPPLPDNLTP